MVLEVEGAVLTGTPRMDHDMLLASIGSTGKRGKGAGAQRVCDKRGVFSARQEHEEPRIRSDRAGCDIPPVVELIEIGPGRKGRMETCTALVAR